MKVGEASTFGGHAIDVRRFNFRRPETPEIAVALIVRKDDDKIRLGFVGVRKPREPRGDGEKEGDSEQHGETRWLEAGGGPQSLIEPASYGVAPRGEMYRRQTHRSDAAPHSFVMT